MKKSDYIARLKKARDLYEQRLTSATNIYDERVELASKIYILENNNIPIGSIIKAKTVPQHIKVDDITVKHFPHDDSVEIYYHGLPYKKVGKGFVRTKSKLRKKFAESNSFLVKR